MLAYWPLNQKKLILNLFQYLCGNLTVLRVYPSTFKDVSNLRAKNIIAKSIFKEVGGLPHQVVKYIISHDLFLTVCQLLGLDERKAPSIFSYGPQNQQRALIYKTERLVTGCGV